jgi:hypothetical protein
MDNPTNHIHPDMRIGMQAAFDAIWRHFVVDGGAPAYDFDVAACVYRGEGGCRCAVGVLLSEQDAQAMCVDARQMNAGAILDKYPESFNRSPLIAACFPGAEVCSNDDLRGDSYWAARQFLMQAQRAHDEAAFAAAKSGHREIRIDLFREYVQDKLRGVGHTFGLAVPA